MDVSLFLAQFFGIAFLVMGVATIVNFNNCRQLIEELVGNKALFTTVTALEFLVGLLIVLMHTVWGTAWQSIITVIAWLMTLEGAFYLVLPPESGIHVVKAFNRKEWFVIGIILSFVIGIYFSYIGFFA